MRRLWILLLFVVILAACSGELRVGLQEGKDGVVGDGRFPRVGNRRDAVFRVYGRGGDAVRTGRTWAKTGGFHP